MSFNKIMKFAFVICLVGALLSSCAKEEPLIQSQPEISNSSVRNFINQGVVRSNHENSEESSDDDADLVCFTFVFPVTVALPDGENPVANNDDELWQIFDNWFDANNDGEELDSLEYPIIVFPLNIMIPDGSTQEINNEDELGQIIEDCFEEFGDEWGHEVEEFDCDIFDEDEFEELDSLCFEIVFPIKLLFPDGTDNEVTSDEELYSAIDQWYENNPESEEAPIPDFPVSIIKDDGTSATISNIEELNLALFDCYGEHSDEDYDEEYDEDIDEEDVNLDNLCFKFEFPITLVIPDGSKEQVTDLETLEKLLTDWYANNPESEEDPLPEFPITITLDDGTSETINDAEKLEKAIDKCDEENDDDDDDDGN